MHLQYPISKSISKNLYNFYRPSVVTMIIVDSRFKNRARFKMTSFRLFKTLIFIYYVVNKFFSSQGIKFGNASFALTVFGNGNSLLTCLSLGSLPLQLIGKTQQPIILTDNCASKPNSTCIVGIFDFFNIINKHSSLHSF